jgi:hypothetical protein
LYVDNQVSLVVVGVGLVLVGAALVGNVGGLADKGARFNARLRGLYVNSQPSAWRVTGAMFVAVGLPLAIWAAIQRI